MSWQAGDEGRIEGTFTDTQTGNPIAWTNTTAHISLKPPGVGEPESDLEPTTEDGGKVWADYLFDKPGVYSGHITLTGEYRRKVPWRLEVFDD